MTNSASPPPADAWKEELFAGLRTATANPHHRLDHHPVLAPLIRPGLAPEAYRRALVALHGISAPVEARIGEHVARARVPWDHAGRRRLPDLESDLAHFGWTPPAPFWDGPQVDSPGALIGCLYVLEGSTLGGRVIYRCLASSLGVTPTAGGRFFHGRGEATPACWESFRDFATRHCAPTDLPAAVRAACDLFAAYSNLLDSTLS